MGTDIHMLAERRVNGKWEMVKERVFRNLYYKPDGKYSFEQDEFTNDPYSGRNYDLFAILADVRNGVGFAGCMTGDHLDPISEPKGYPADLDEDAKKDLDGTSDYDDNLPHLSREHSASYLTLKELLDYDWLGQSHRSFGYVTEDEYVTNIKKGKAPTSWCGGVGGAGVRSVSPKEMDAILANFNLREVGVDYYVGCWFPAESYADAAGSFYSSTIPTLKTLIPDGGTADDVRIVFDFDS